MMIGRLEWREKKEEKKKRLKENKTSIRVTKTDDDDDDDDDDDKLETPTSVVFPFFANSKSERSMYCWFISSLNSIEYFTSH